VTATGLVRSWAVRDGAVYAVLATNFVTLGMVEFANSTSIPRGQLLTSVLVSGVWVSFLVVTYAGLIVTVPRAGGDYIWQSRFLSGGLGFVVSIGVAGYARAQLWCLGGGLFGFLLMVAVLIAFGHGHFESSVDGYGAQLFHLRDAYKATLAAGASSSHFGLTPFGSSLRLVLMMMFYLLWPNTGSSLYGEVKGADEFRRVALEQCLWRERPQLAHIHGLPVRARRGCLRLCPLGTPEAGDRSPGDLAEDPRRIVGIRPVALERRSSVWSSNSLSSEFGTQPHDPPHRPHPGPLPSEKLPPHRRPPL